MNISTFVFMKKEVFKIVAKLNKWVLPSMTNRQLDMAKAKKWQFVLLGWRYFVTKNSL